MTETQRALFEKAYRALETARANLSRGDAEAASNRAYYAAFHAATPALLSVGEAPKSHAGAIKRFSLHFIKTGRIPASTGKIFTRAFDIRQRADYEAFAVFDEAATADLLADVERFVKRIEALLQTED